ncbi:unnamed protein product [Laminaria digitata]
MSSEGAASSKTATPGLHKSCDLCGLKKRRCGGGNPCRRCIQMGETCTYSKRRPRAGRLQTRGAVYVGSAGDPSVHAPSTLQPGPGVSAALQQYGRVSLKRCRLRPSPATGLVGMQENMFLSDYFDCVGFLPFTSQSNIRETLVNVFAGSVSVQQSDSEDYSTTDQHFDAIMPADGQLPADPSICVFWCAVALGALVKGRPIESVEKYSRLAREALVNVSGPPTAEAGRGWAILAYLSDFSGDRDNFHEFVKRANAIICEVEEQEDETLPVGLSDLVKHGETIRIYVGDVNKEEVDSFCNQKRPIPQITQAATKGEICKFVMQSYRSFGQALYRSGVEHHRPTAGSLGADGEPSADMAQADPLSDDFLRGSSPHCITSLMQEQVVDSGSSGMLDIMMTMLRENSRQFELIEHAAGRPDIRQGIGGLIINTTLVFERLATKDICGALGNLEVCGEVFQRYPGLCRFTMGAHGMHMLLANLAGIDGPRARAVYDKMRVAYNSVLLPGTPAIPPFEEWQGVASCCDNYHCRWVFICTLVSGPMVDSDVARIVDEQSQSNRLTDLGAQVAEALLLSPEFGRGGIMIGETEEDIIGVGDWLDVTHAMLGASGPGLDFG